MAAVWTSSVFLLLLVHVAIGLFDVDSNSEQVLKVTPGQMVSVACPSRALGKNDIVTWETSGGEFLGMGEDFLIGSVDKAMDLVCRRRSFRSKTMDSARVRVLLNKRSQTNDRIYLQRSEWTDISCVDSPKEDYFFEWVNPEQFQVSRSNVLHIQLVKDTDFGYYICRPFSDKGPLPIKKVYILEDTNRAFTMIPPRTTHGPWRTLKELHLKIVSGNFISALCLHDDHPRNVEVRWHAPDGSSFEGNRLMKRAHSREDFGHYSCEAVSRAGDRWRRRVVVQNKASERSANFLQNDFSWWGGKKTSLTTMIPTPATQRMAFTTTMSSTTNRRRTTSTIPTYIRMRKVEYVIDKRDLQAIECPEPGDVGRYPGFTQSRVYWLRDGRKVSMGSRLKRRNSIGLFGNYECWRIYENEAGGVRKIQIPVIIIEMPTKQTLPTTRKPIQFDERKSTPYVARIYELAPQTIKVLKNETVMLVCPTSASVTAATSRNLTLRSVRQTWRDRRGVIGYKKFIFVSTLNAKMDMKYSCQHDFNDEEGRMVSLFKNYTLRSSSNQIELPVEDILIFRSTKIRLLCVSNPREGDSYEWIHPSGQPVSASNLLERFVVDDLDFGEYYCTVWRADGTSQLQKVRVNEKLPKRAKTVTRRRLEWLRLRCIESPPPRTTFEWVHPKRTVVSRQNNLRWQLRETADFGHYVCYAKPARGSVPPTDFMVLEYPVSPFVKTTLRASTTPKPVRTGHDEDESVVRRRPGDWISLRCWDDPQAELTFEWVHPNSDIVSGKNTLHWQLKREVDFGHYVCHAYMKSVHIRSRHVAVLKVGGGVYPESKTRETVYLRRKEVTHLKCIAHPQGENMYEWTNPLGFVVSQNNLLQIKLLNDLDFGHYNCKTIGESGPLPDRDIFIEEDKTDLLTQVPITPITPEVIKVTVRPSETVNISCVDNPPLGTSFEWVDEKGFQRSNSNYLSLTVIGSSDTGKFSCSAFSPSGPLPSREIVIILKPIEIIKVTKLEAVNISCVDNPPSGTSFEWVDEKGFQRSTSNYLSLIIIGSSDTGKFSCSAFSPSGPLPSREIVIIIKPVGLEMTPESGVIKACAGQGSASALCWIENRQTTPRWRDLRRNSSRMQTSVLSSRRARLALRNVDISDDGRVFECYSRALQLTRRLTVKVEDCQRVCECQPNEVRCSANGNVPSRGKQCIPAHWMCDGENDCGNGYDERDCPQREINFKERNCEGQTLRCARSNKVIPKGFWCDTEADCDHREDEVGCQTPQIVEPSEARRIEVRLDKPVSMRCVGIGVPPPELIWRFNWDCLPPGVRSNCSCGKQGEVYTTHCTLTSDRVTRDQLGIFTCEAINNRGRAFAEDYHLILL